MKYALGKEVTGSGYSNYSATSERDISREVWSRIINNMPSQTFRPACGQTAWGCKA